MTMKTSPEILLPGFNCILKISYLYWQFCFFLLHKRNFMNYYPPPFEEDAFEPPVVFNGVALSKEQLNEFAKTYGQKPGPGNYWYDKRCGLYGIEGQPAQGFMYPGHEFGDLVKNASNGNSGVLFNGREITQFEWMMLSQLLGTPVLPGTYWLDAQGNAGIQGNAFPLVNLFMATQQNAGRSGGAGGDNFWSSRYSAGNYTEDGSAGYVSVPGYGPVSYGM
jgi:hypothetical protein